MTHQVSPMGTFFTPALPGMAYDILCLFAYTPVSEALVLVLFLLYHLFLDLNNDRFVSKAKDKRAVTMVFHRSLSEVLQNVVFF